MANDTLLKQLERSLTEAGMTHGGRPLMAGLSGGADSVCLLRGLLLLGYKVVALHCNFHLRGAESNGDEAFCRSLCQELGVELHTADFATTDYAVLHGVSIEMAARTLRYDWFARMHADISAQALCVAHHRDDAVETMLLNLIRGTGLHGLTGMRLRRTLVSSDGHHSVPVVRPMLGLSRQDIEQWLRDRHHTWRTDSTNLDPDEAMRNAIRLRLLPMMQQLNPSVAESLNATAHRLHEAELLYDEAVANARNAVMQTNDCIDINKLLATTAPRTLLHEMLKPLGFTAAQADEVAVNLSTASSGAQWWSDTHRLLRDRNLLLISDRRATEQMLTEAAHTMILPQEGMVATATGIRLDIRRQVRTPDYVVTRSKNTATFDLEKLTLPLEVRLARRGDRLRPFGMNGTRLVSDVLTDAKLSVAAKECQLVVTSGGVIVWVVGVRTAAGYEVDSSTRHIMTISIMV